MSTDLSVYARSFPAAAPDSAHWTDRVVTQGHADYCAAHGHASWTEDGVAAPRCPRCGADTTPSPIVETYYANPHDDGPHDAARVSRFAPTGRAYTPAEIESAASDALTRPAAALQRIGAWVYCRAAA